MFSRSRSLTKGIMRKASTAVEKAAKPRPVTRKATQVGTKVVRRIGPKKKK